MRLRVGEVVVKCQTDSSSVAPTGPQNTNVRASGAAARAWCEAALAEPRPAQARWVRAAPVASDRAAAKLVARLGVVLRRVEALRAGAVACCAPAPACWSTRDETRTAALLRRGAHSD